MDDVLVLYEGRHLRFVRRGHWEFAQRKGVSGIVGILPITDDGKVVLVEQFRLPVNARVVEIPAGLAGDVAGSETEALADAARRELEEETGYRAATMTLLTSGAASAGISDEIITIFRAEGLAKVGAGGGDEHEDIEVHEVPLKDIRAWLEGKSRGGHRRSEGVHGSVVRVSGPMHYA